MAQTEQHDGRLDQAATARNPFMVAISWSQGPSYTALQQCASKQADVLRNSHPTVRAAGTLPRVDCEH